MKSRPTLPFDRRESYRIKRSEFWPDFLWQWPLYAQGIPLGLWKGGLTWFARVNPGMRWGGMLAYSKSEIMQQLPVENRAAEERFHLPTQKEALKSRLAGATSWPMILKPDQGERGRDVHKLRDARQAEAAIEGLDSGTWLLQAYLDLPYEFGVFVEKSTSTDVFTVTSLCLKQPLGVSGDGVHTIACLVAQNPRAMRYRSLLEEVLAQRGAEVPAQGKWVALHFSGNHCQGAAFINKSEYIDAALSATFDRLLRGVDGFRFGRLDVLVESPAALSAVDRIKVIEINGANSEPAHVYDYRLSPLGMLMELLRFQRRMWRQALFMQSKGVESPPLSVFWPEMKRYKALMAKSKQQKKTVLQPTFETTIFEVKGIPN